MSQLCRRLDGAPLAIELAALRVAAMSPAALVRRLDRRFRLLSGGDRVAIERHQTLRATIDWSYDLLDEAQQRLLGRLAVFGGGCTLDAAEAVCAPRRAIPRTFWSYWPISYPALWSLPMTAAHSRHLQMYQYGEALPLYLISSRGHA